MPPSAKACTARQSAAYGFRARPRRGWRFERHRPRFVAPSRSASSGPRESAKFSPLISSLKRFSVMRLGSRQSFTDSDCDLWARFTVHRFPREFQKRAVAQRKCARPDRRCAECLRWNSSQRAQENRPGTCAYGSMRTYRMFSWSFDSERPPTKPRSVRDDFSEKVKLRLLAISKNTDLGGRAVLLSVTVM